MSNPTAEKRLPWLCRFGLHRWKACGGGWAFDCANGFVVVGPFRCKRCGREAWRSV